MVTVAANGNDNPKPEGPVVVLVGATARSGELERLAQGLEKRGVEVTVVSAIERTSVPLLQISFRFGANARYMLCGSPELPPPVLEKLRQAIAGNGVPPANVWAGPVQWGDPQALLTNTEHRLAALGLDLAPAPRLEVPPAGPTMPSYDATPSGKVPIIPPSARPPADDDEPLRLPAGPIARAMASRGGLAAIGATLVLAGGLTTLRLTADDPDAAPSDVAVADGSTSPEGSTRRGSDEADAEPEAAAEVPPPRAEAQIVDEDPTEPPAGELELDADADADADVEPEPEAEPTIDLDIEPDRPALPDDAELVYEALKRQSIRAIDVLLVSPPALKKRGRRMRHRTMRFADAEAYCASLVVDGITGWRLPEVGEVGWMSKANVVTQGLYWTATKADAFGTERVIWNVKRRKMSPANVRWRGGRAVCVRFQRHGDGPE